MSNYCPIYTSIWSDIKFTEYTAEQQLIFLYLTTNPSCEISGIYQISPKQIAYSTNIDKDVVVDILSDRFNTDVLEYDFESGTIFVKDFFKYNSVKGGNPTSIYKKIKTNLESIKNQRFVSDFLAIYKAELDILNGKTHLYIISLKAPYEEFIKIGVSHDYQKRFKKFESYKYKVEVLFLREYEKREEAVHDEGTLLSSEIKSFKYIPIRKFDGSNECFTKKVLEEPYLLNYLKDAI